MERITYRITLDAYKNGIQRTLQGFETGDNVSRRLAINLVSGGDTFEIAQDVIAMIYVHNGSVPSINACEIVDNTIIYDVLPITEEGIFEMQVKLIEVGINGAQKVLVAPKFAVEVTESGTGDNVATGTTTFTALENALAKAEAVYNSRIIGVEIGDDCIFKVMYADGTVYENDYLKEALYNGNALLSESFAHGNTGIREGENTDNAKYYSNVSKSASEDAKIVSDEARVLLNEAMLQTTFTAFKVDFESGELTYMSANYNFDVNEETGNLEADPEGGYNPEELVGTVVDEFIDKKSEEIDEKFTVNENKNAEQDKKLAECENKIAAQDSKLAECENKIVQLSNPNLLINGDFQVNQRGTTQYQCTDYANRVYTVDRWSLLGGSVNNPIKATVNNDGSITITTMETGGYINYLFEKILPSDNYTLSFKVKNVINAGYYVEGLHKTKQTIQTDLVVDTVNGTPTKVVFAIEPNGSITLEWVKLEQGSVATPFIPRLYAEELALCKRYYQQKYINYYYYATTGTSKIYISFDTPIREMRVSPTVTLIGEVSIAFGKTGDTIGSSSVHGDYIYISNTTTTALLCGATYHFDAEIY